MEKRKVTTLFIIAMCLLGGAGIYFTSRPESIFLNQWLAQISGGSLFHFFQSFLPGSLLPGWIVFSLPDALWMLALTLLVLLIWDFKVNRKSIPWIGLAVCSGLLFELLQVFHIVRGTFDIVDLMLILVAALVPISITLLKSTSCQTA